MNDEIKLMNKHKSPTDLGDKSSVETSREDNPQLQSLKLERDEEWSEKHFDHMTNYSISFTHFNSFFMKLKNTELNTDTLHIELFLSSSIRFHANKYHQKWPFMLKVCLLSNYAL